MISEFSNKVKVLLLAPTSASQGGIARWTKLLLDNSSGRIVQYNTIDTSVKYRVLGGQSGIIDRMFGLKDSLKRFFRLLYNLFTYRPDIIYLTCAPSVGFAFRDAPLIILSKLFRKKVIIHLRGGNINGFWGGNVLRRFLANIGSKLADYIFVITRECEAFSRNKFGNNKVIYIPNFIESKSECFSCNDVPDGIRKDAFNIIHVAFQCREKGTFEVIDAAKHLPDNVNILLIGIVSEENKDAITDVIQKNEVGHKVRLFGAINKPGLWAYYENAELFLFPTYSEGFPNVVMEAMLYGLPILATNVGNIAEITSAKKRPAAILLEKADPPNPLEIADKIKNLMANSELQKQLSNNGLENIKHYALEVVIPQLEEILISVSRNNDVLSDSKKYFHQNESIN